MKWEVFVLVIMIVHLVAVAHKGFYAGIYWETKTDEGGSLRFFEFNLADGSGGSVGITDPTFDVSGDKDLLLL